MRALILLCFVMLSCLFGSCSQQEQSVSIKQQSQIPIEESKKMYESLCSACHGKLARGGVGPDLTVSRFKYGKNRTDITKSIMIGRSGGMPAFSSHLKLYEAEALADYLLLLK
jgi:mono/diheme cytochrome c family protein